MLKPAGSSAAFDMTTIQQQSNRLQNLLFAAAAGVFALLIYGATIAPDLTWSHFGSDGGELITAAITSGIPHPPGYPTYIVLGKIANLLPLAPAALRFNVLSAVSAAAAAAFVTATALNILAATKHAPIVAAATGLSVAFAPLVWGQALITEVYALNFAILSIFIWSLLSRRSPRLSGLLLGLAITTHLSSLLMLPLALVLTSRPRWKDLFLGLLIGLVPFLLLPILAQSASPVVWGNPTTISGWWWLVSGRLYHANIRLLESGASFTKAAVLAGALLSQLAWVGWLFVVLGILTKLLEKRVTISLLATALFYFFYGFLYQTDDAIVNLLPLILLLSPLLATGLSRIGAWSLLLPVALLLLNYQAINLTNDRSVRPLASHILSSAPENAILLTAGDQSIFTLWYFHHVEEMRGDIYLVDANLLAFDWYRDRLRRHYPELLALEKDDLDEFRTANGRLRPVCEVPLQLSGVAQCAFAVPDQTGQNSGG